MLSILKEQATQILKYKNSPTKKQEEWRYSDLSLLENNNDIPTKKLNNTISLDKRNYYIILVNGILDENRSHLPKQDIYLHNNKKQIFLDLLNNFDLKKGFDSKYHVLQNYSQNTSSLLIDVTDSLDKPLKIYHLNNENCYCTIFLRIRKNVNIKLYEEYIQQANFVNQVIKIELNDNASCKHLRQHHLVDNTKFLYSSEIICKTNARYNNYSLNTKYNSYRQDIECILQSKGATCNFYGVNIGKTQQKYDIILKVRHQNSHTNSKQHYNQILADNSRGSFYSKVEIPNSLKKIEAHQLNKNLLLNNTAQAFTRPELDIHSDDVICSHGATIGNIDLDAINYFKSRGIDDFEAKKLIIEGFLKNVFENKGLDKGDFKTFATQIKKYTSFR